MSTKKLFPSGRSVVRCKDDAKKMARLSKQTDLPITLSTALDLVAKANGVPLPWAEAINHLKSPQAPKTTRIAQGHLLGHALNKLLDEQRVSLDPSSEVKEGFLECELLGKSTVILWADAGYSEIRLSVWWNFDKQHHPQHPDGGFKEKILPEGTSDHDYFHLITQGKDVIHSSSNTIERYNCSTPLAKPQSYRKFVGVICSTWVEREQGQYLQLSSDHKPHDSYIRNSDRKALTTIPDCIPKGFSLTGQFHF